MREGRGQEALEGGAGAPDLRSVGLLSEERERDALQAGDQRDEEVGIQDAPRGLLERGGERRDELFAEAEPDRRER
ncbi:MAG TPA: hypothetical protein DEF51_32990 [Myxococcales bacterium]|nr:hypothetical protein [Myxococcales bacterium]